MCQAIRPSRIPLCCLKWLLRRGQPESFATALTGGDPSQIEKMRAAFKKGYEQAEKTWGGKLPDISKQTYDAVMAGFDKMAEDAGLTTNN